MNYDFIIYGGGMSSQIAALALAKDNFKVCLIENSTIKKSDSNLVTFLSQGSVNYLYSIIDDPNEFNQFANIEKILYREKFLSVGTYTITDPYDTSDLGTPPVCNSNLVLS